MTLPSSHGRSTLARVSRIAASRAIARFDPCSFSTFRFVSRSLHSDGDVSLRYALDDVHEFEERFRLPADAPGDQREAETLEGLLNLLHWVAGVSYYKAAVPPSISCETGDPPPAARALLDALYSEGLGEFAAVNGLAALPRPEFPTTGEPTATAPRDQDSSASRATVAWGRSTAPSDQSSSAGRATVARGRPTAPSDQSSSAGRAMVGRGRPGNATNAARQAKRLMVPVGGGKDSAVAIEIVRASGLDALLFSIGDPPPIAGTVRVAGMPRLLAIRAIDPHLLECNAAGALNGHVPVTAIVSCAALLTAALNGLDAVVLANERSASSPNTVWNGVEINHQFSKGARAERLLSAAAAEVPGAPSIFSILRPASELAIARAFARLPRYHQVFTSCNRVFRNDPARRSPSWCRDCDKCRFVFLILAPFMSPAELRDVFGADLLDDERQYPGFASLTATGAPKPFECIGEERESIAAIRMLAGDSRWRDHAVVRRLEAQVLPRFGPGDADASDPADPAALLALSDDHSVPAGLIRAVDAVLGA
jgi:hypothetical protein